MSLFETLFADATDALDEVFAEPLEYRAGGFSIAVSGVLASHRMGMAAERDLAESWHEEVVELPASSLVTPGGDAFLPEPSHEIAKTLANGRKEVYTVVNGPQNRPYEWPDADHSRLAIYCRLLRTEAAP